MEKEQTILDDGEYLINLNCNYDAKISPGFLLRRCSLSPTTPGGYDYVGGFEKSSDGTWRADVNSQYDPLTDGDCRIVIQGVSRMDAIVALWVNRKTALPSHR